jgi:hypothetical protein
MILIVSIDMPNTRPYVAAACLCEKVILEPDGVASLIRIVDTYTLKVPTTVPPSFRPAIELTVFVSIKSGDVTGQHEVGLLLRQPNRKSPPIQKWPVVLNGGEHGANVTINFTLVGEPGAAHEAGLYWFDVLWEGEVLTSIPLRLKLEAPTAAPDSPHKP